MLAAARFATITGYSTKRVSRMLKISIRRLQHYDETGIVKATHDGYNRCWQAVELSQLAMLDTLQKKGISVHQVAALLKSKKLQEAFDEIPADGTLWLWTDGKKWATGNALEMFHYVQVATTKSVIAQFRRFPAS